MHRVGSASKTATINNENKEKKGDRVMEQVGASGRWFFIELWEILSFCKKRMFGNFCVEVP